MRNCMVDLETLGTNSDAVVVSIGAVMFGPEGVSENGFYAVLDRTEQIRLGRKINSSTVDWWMQQSVEARAVFKVPTEPVGKVLTIFSEFVGNDPFTWGNGADFDCTILGSLYSSFNLQKPWSYSKNRCFRTLKNTVQPTKNLPRRKGTHHNALHDAIHQAKHAVILMQGKLKWE